MKDETPRTHAFLAENSSGFGMAIFARQLERELSAAKADLAKIRAHAEAMATTLDDWSRIDQCPCVALDNYRAEFPEGEK